MLILKIRLHSRSDFWEAYNQELPSGGMFCPTTKALEENDPVFVELFFPGLPNKMMIRGRVIWWRPALPRLRVRAGAMVAFLDEEAEKRDFILRIADNEQENAIKRRHVRIPIQMSVEWRMVDSTEKKRCMLRDISIGGALLVTDEPLKQDDDIILELKTPGSEIPIDIAGKVTYSSPNGKGIKFLYRDGGGSQRLKEVVRRLINTGGKTG